MHDYNTLSKLSDDDEMYFLMKQVDNDQIQQNYCASSQQTLLKRLNVKCEISVLINTNVPFTIQYEKKKKY